MKLIFKLTLLFLLLVGCGNEKKMTEAERQEIAEIYKADAEKDYIDEMLENKHKSWELAIDCVYDSRNRVASASSPNELVLAEDDLREARKNLEKVEADLKMHRSRQVEIKRLMERGAELGIPTIDHTINEINSRKEKR